MRKSLFMLVRTLVVGVFVAGLLAAYGFRMTDSGGPTIVRAASAAKVEIYVTSWCPYCKKAIEFLKANGISYTAYDTENDASARDRLSRMGYHSVPVAIINGKTIQGFNEEKYREALQLQ